LLINVAWLGFDLTVTSSGCPKASVTHYNSECVVSNAVQTRH